MKKMNQHGLRNLFSNLVKKFVLIGGIAAIATLSACGGGGGGEGVEPPVVFPVSVNVKGLTQEDELILQNNGTHNLGILHNGIHVFTERLPLNSRYDVTVRKNPKGQICTVQNGSGIFIKEIPPIPVVCAAEGVSYTVGGFLEGIIPGTRIVLHNNGGDARELTTDGPFSFSTKVAPGTRYIVTVETHPSGQICTVNNGDNTAAGDVTNVHVKCVVRSDAYTVSGTVSGLKAGKSVVLRNNSGNDTEVTANGSGRDSFTFSTPVANGLRYNVSVSEQPEGQACLPTENTETGTINGKNVSSVKILCSDTQYILSAKVSGLSDGNKLVLTNDGDDLPFSADGTLEFDELLPYQGTFSVTLKDAPVAQDCTIKGGSGVADSDKTVEVTCTSAALNTVQSVASSEAEYFPVGLIQARDGSLYGTTTTTIIRDPIFNELTGYIFKVTPNGVMTNIAPFVGSGDVVPVVYKDPAFPTGLIQASDGNIYGTAYLGGSNFVGTMFKLDTTINEFTQEYRSVPFDSSNKGPVGDLIKDEDGNLYGVTYGDVLIADNVNGGSIFKMTPQGVITTLHTFTFANKVANGVRPSGKLLLVGSDLYGTTEMGGANSRGMIYTIKTSGAGFTPLQSFAAGGSFPPIRTEDARPNSPGPYSDPYARPYSGLTRVCDSNGVNCQLFGVAKYGGTNDAGYIFKLRLTDKVLTTHYSFPKANGYPIFELVQLKDGKLYGTTQGDGTKNNGGDGGQDHNSAYKGTIYRITTTNGAVPEILHTFTGNTTTFDGNRPSTRLVLGNDGTTLYGATRFGGQHDSGIIYKFGGGVTYVP